MITWYSRMVRQDLACASLGAMALAATIALPTVASAQEAGAYGAAGDGISDIVVTARKASASIMGSDVPIDVYPQSVRVFDQRQLEALNTTRLDDVLDLAGGVSRQNDFGGLWDKYAIRGFAGDENAGPDILINRFSSNLGYNAPIDTATIDRIEVLKGASAALSGRGEPGGSINIVTKAPLAQLHASATASYGSWDSWRLATDAGGPVAKGLSVRLINVGEEHDSFRDHVKGSRRLVAPSVSWQASDALRLLYQAEYMRNEATLDRGVVGIAGDARAMDRDVFLGEPADGPIVQKMLWQQASLFADLGDGDGLELGGSQRDGSLRGFGTMVDFGARGLQTNKLTAGRDRRFHDFAWNDLTLRGELTGSVHFLGLDHDLRLGVDRVRHFMDFRLDRARGTPTKPILVIDLLNPVYGQPLPVPPPGLSRTESFRSESIYGQDLVRAGDFTLLLGARWNSFRQNVFNRLTGKGNLDTVNKGVTPRAALSWQVGHGLSLYTSWGESLRLNPSDGVSTFDAERSRSTEVGTKFTSLDGALTGQAALFDMEKRNVLNPNATDPFVKSQIGRQRSRGAEAEVTLNLKDDLYATATYTYVDATVRRDVNTALIGATLSNVPKNAWAFFAYKRIDRLSFGGGVSHVGNRAGDPFASGYRLPSYTIARANVSYAVSSRVTVRVDIDNIFDKYYISSSYANVWTTPGAPRNVRLTISSQL